MIKDIRYVCICIMTAFLLCTVQMQVSAEQTVTSADGQDVKEDENLRVDAAKDSVVQIVIQYMDKDKNTYLLKSGSGVLISDTVVLTNYHLVTLTDEEKENAAQYLSEQTGRQVSFTSQEGSEEASYQIGVVVLRDVVITAAIHEYSSKEMDLAILNLSDTMKRENANLGDSDNIENGDEVFALGYKKVTAMSTGGTELLSQSDCKESKGKINKVVLDSHMHYISHTADVHAGNSGGPLVDSEGNVIGINIYSDSQNEDETATAFMALSVNEIKELLDSCELTYQEAGLFTDVEEELLSNLGEEDEENVVDTSLLDNYIVSFNMLEQSNYTPESYGVLQAALQKAKEIKSDKEVTQEEIDEAVLQLEISKSGLKMVSKVNWPFIITMIVLAVVVISALVIYILNLKGIIGSKHQKEDIVTLNSMVAQSHSALAAQSGKINAPQSNRLEKPKPRNSGKLHNNGNTVDAGGQGTTVLGSFSQSEGTTVLGVSQNQSYAYLTRLKTTEKITLDINEFIIGKDRSSVNYCIGDNTTISRRHARLVRRGTKYYLSDLNSTNSTYLNDRMLMSGEELEINDGDIVKISNEEFIFTAA